MRRPSEGVGGAGAPGVALVWFGERPSEVLSSKPAISASPVEKGRWKTAPDGCTVIAVTSGRRLRGRYAAVTEVSTGPWPLSLVSVARHWRYRALGLPIDRKSTRLNSSH